MILQYWLTMTSCQPLPADKVKAPSFLGKYVLLMYTVYASEIYYLIIFGLSVTHSIRIYDH